MTLFLWAVILMCAALAFVILEAFLPSGGLLSLLAAVSLIASIAVAFMTGAGTGVLFLAIATFGLPAVGFVMLKFWPHTPFGQMILIGLPDSDDVLPETEEYRGLKDLIGRRGIARTKMLPSGAVAIDNRMYDALSPGVPVEAGEIVEVIGVDMNHVVVAPVDPNEDLEETKAPESSAENALSQPLEEFGLEELG